MNVTSSSALSNASETGGGGGSLGATILVSTLYLVIMLIGLFGNCLVIVTILIDKRMRASVTNLYILNLACSDMLSLLLALAEIGFRLTSQHWFLGLTACKLLRFVMTAAFYTSVITLTTVCVERYVAIVHPMRAHLWFSRRRTLLTLACCWSLGLGLASQSLAFLTVMPVPPRMHRRCVARYADTLAEQMRISNAVGMAELAVFYFLPLCLQVALYSRMSATLFGSFGARAQLRINCAGQRQQQQQQQQQAPARPLAVPNASASQQQQQQQQQPKQNRRQKRNENSAMAGRQQVVKMLIACVVVYFVCYLSKLLEVVFRIAGYQPIRPDTAKTVVMAMIYANSAVNPLLYTAFSRNFRRQFRLTFSRCCCREERLAGGGGPGGGRQARGAGQAGRSGVFIGGGGTTLPAASNWHASIGVGADISEAPLQNTRQEDSIPMLPVGASAAASLQPLSH